MATVRDVLTATLQELGLIAATDEPSAEDISLAFDRLNDWIDGLRHEHLTMPVVTRTTWPLTSAVSYAIGSSAAIDVERPQGPSAIQDVGYVDNGQSPAAEYLLTLFTDEQYAAIRQKALTSNLPQGFYYEATSPTGTVLPWPLPTDSNLLGVIYTLAPLSEFTSLDDTFAPAKGFRRFARTNLAIELASAFHRTPAETTQRAAMESKAQIKISNYRPFALRCEDAVIGAAGAAWNINTDAYNR